MVAERGVGALTLRALAAASGTSTTAVYALFGGKAQLLQALFQAAFDSFGQSQADVPVTDDPLADLYALGSDYRSWSLNHPHLYAVMFGGALAGFEPDDESVQRSNATMAPLQALVARALAAGLFGHANAGAIAFAIWAGVHGLVSLELGMAVAHLSRTARDTAYDTALGAIVRGWQA